MKTIFVTLQAGNRIYLPKQIVSNADLHMGDVLAVKCSENKKGIVLYKPTFIGRLDHDFHKLDKEFENLYKNLIGKK